MRVVVGGVEYEGFSRVEVDVDMTRLCRKFSLTAETLGVDDIPFRKGQSVRISVGDDRIFTGWVERISVGASGDGMSYSISGRDLLADLVDSNLDGMGDTGLTVKHAAEASIRHLGLGMKVIDLAGTDSRPFERQNDIVAPEPQATAFDYLRSVAQRRQVLITSDGFANLVITQGIGLRVSASILHRSSENPANNVEEMDYETDDSQRFGVYTTDSQLNATALARKGASVNPREVANTTASFKDPTIRSSRRRTIATESSYPRGDASSRAKWEANLSRAEGTRYQVSVFGHRHAASGELWRPNTAPLVIDDFVGIEGRMLIKGISYIDDERGETTTMNFTEPGAFQAELAAIEGQILD